MNNTIEYKNYIGSIEFSEADGIFFGKVQGIRASITYEGSNAHELIEDFHESIDDYLALCEAVGKEPEKAYKGSFNVRVSSEIHKQSAIRALSENISLNSFVERALQQALSSTH